MLKFHARLSCLVLSIIILLIVFSINPFQNYFQIGNCMRELSLIFRFQISHEFKQGLLFD